MRRRWGRHCGRRPTTGWWGSWPSVPARRDWQLTGEGGLLSQLTKRVMESALDGELDNHLGYGKHDSADRDGGNSRNGKRGKTVLTAAGPVPLEVPRDRDTPSSRSWSRSVSGA
jgi:hypothetical protein